MKIKVCTKCQLPKSKPINQYNLQGIFIKTWKSGHEIKQVLGFDKGNISKACLKKYKQAYGFIWKFKIKDKI